MGSDSLHVAVYAFPFTSHPATLLIVIKRLAKSTPNIIFSFFNTSKSNTQLFSSNHHDIPSNIRPYNVWDGVPSGYVMKGQPQEDIKLFMETAPVTLRKEVEKAEEETGRKVSCMIGDGFLWFAADMAEERSVPWVASWAGGAHSLAIHVYTDVIRESIGIEDAERRKEEPLTFIPGMSGILVRDLPDRIFSMRPNTILSQTIHQMSKNIHRASAVILNSFDELNLALTNNLRSKFQSFLPIGPYNLLPPPKYSQLTDPHHTLLWLDQQPINSVAYIGFGTAGKLSPTEIIALAEALETTKVKFVWSMRDEDQKSHFPKGFLERNKVHGVVAPWVPQDEVLRHKAVGVFVTHFGWNSIMESMTAEVPMIGRPLIGEHKLNGRFAEVVWEIGVAVDGGVFTKEGAKKGFERVLFSDDGENMRRKLKLIRELAEKAVGDEGSSIGNLQALTEIVMMPHGA